MRRWLTHMRDDALARLAKDGPKYTIKKVTPAADENDPILFRIEGSFTAPLYLNTLELGGRLVFGDDGLPLAQGTHEVPFGMMIPHGPTPPRAPDEWSFRCLPQRA